MTDVQPRNDEIDLSRAWRALSRNALVIAAVPLLAAGLTYVVSKRQTPVYEATVSILSAGNQTGNATVNNTLVSAPALPQGALEKAITSRDVLMDIRSHLKDLPGASQAAKAALADELKQEAAARRSTTFSVRGRLDITGNGTYDLTARHTSPALAAALANDAARALVDWDTNRGLLKVKQAREALEAQLADVTARITAAGPLPASPGLDQRSLLDERALVNTQLNSIIALERAVSGTLSIVAPAVAPTDPVAPRPLRNAALAGLLAFFAACGLVLLRASLDRSVTTPADLKSLDLSSLGEIPRFQLAKRGSSPLPAFRRGPAHEALGFLRTTLASVLKEGEKTLLVTSTVPGEGKSSLTAALADSFAATGKRVLLVDADMRKPGQPGIWGMAADTADWVNLPGAAPFPGEERQDLAGAIRTPEAAQAKAIKANLHYLPAGQPNSHAPEILSGGNVARALKAWAAGYDLVIIDSPPVLVVSDPLLIAPHVGGTLLVLASGQASQNAAQRAVEALTLVEANLLGAVLNKLDPRNSEDSYGYGYGRKSYGYGYGAVQVVRKDK